MRSNMQIRVFHRRDLRRILEIERTVFPSEAYERRMFDELYHQCGDLFFVAERLGRAVGYMVTCAPARKAEIISIAVDLTKQQRAVGRALMKHTLDELRKRGVQSVELMVRRTNTAAVRFYRRFRFKRTGVVAHYYHDGGDGVRMTKELAPRTLLRRRAK